MKYFKERSYADYSTVFVQTKLRSTDSDPRTIIIDKLIEHLGLVVVETFDDDPSYTPGYNRDSIHLMTRAELAQKREVHND